MTDPAALVCFAHGKESGPWGTKIRHLAKTSEQRGFAVLSPDYSHTMDPDQRVRELIALRPSAQRLVLVGSSMGGYVSAHACRELRPDALFLMAPALYFPGWEREPEQIPALCATVHGWRDEIVPVDRSLRFAERHHADLHVLDSDHGLNDQLDSLARLLGEMLDRVMNLDKN